MLALGLFDFGYAYLKQTVLESGDEFVTVDTERKRNGT